MKLSTAMQGFWLDKELSLSVNTAAKYRHFLGLLSDHVGDADIESVTTAHIKQFLIATAAQRNWSKRTIHDVWAVLSSFWAWASGELDTPNVIKGKISAPAYTEKRIDPFTEGELRAIVKAAEHQRVYDLGGKPVRAKRPTAKRDVAMILVLLDSGMRVSELCGLTVADYDPARGRLHIRDGKGGKQRFTVLGNRARKALWVYLAGRQNAKQGEPLFTTRDGGHMARENVLTTCKRIGAAAGVNGVHPHRFRHTMATMFLRNGGSPLLLQELLGHERLETVRVYVEIAAQDVDAAARHSPADNWRL